MPLLPLSLLRRVAWDCASNAFLWVEDAAALVKSKKFFMKFWLFAFHEMIGDFLGIVYNRK